MSVFTHRRLHGAAFSVLSAARAAFPHTCPILQGWS
ncbi:hypothetical protein predicted by Glimmer/Critica [Acetobacter ghanensis]|uniref:Uncharacterized protein n=1 Tax=Acetobacter ghanensis TaxID=431306 RepID=A0A0U5EZ84_9PROT|nr:hypothetical protein predicted by Glimmer/Critica [Acetobacter ghanensis]